MLHWSFWLFLVVWLALLALQVRLDRRTRAHIKQARTLLDLANTRLQVIGQMAHALDQGEFGLAAELYANYVESLT